jgi:hypothetical protein
MQSHLLLAMGSIMEQREIIKDLHSKVHELESQGGKHAEQLTTLVASLGATTLAITESGKYSIQFNIYLGNILIKSK